MNTPESLWTDINKIVEAQQSKRRVVLGTERATQRPFYESIPQRLGHLSSFISWALSRLLSDETVYTEGESFT